MTPQGLVAALIDANEEAGRRLIHTQLPLMSDTALDRFVYLLKKEADRRWTNDVNISFLLSGHLLLVGKITQNRYYHALGLMARGDVLRRMDRDQEALPFIDAAGEEFLAVNDEVGWARTRIGRVSACLRLNRTTEALRDAAAAREIFMRYGKLLRAGQIDVNAAVINFELGHYDQAIRLFDRAIETYLQLEDEGVELYLARARGNKALTLAAMGRFREAVALHEQARATFAQRPDQEIAVAREETNIADIYTSQGHYSQALLLFDRSRTLFQKHNMPFDAAEVAQQMCYCLMRLNRVREAYELALETVRVFRSSSAQRHNLARSLMHLASAATAEGDFREAEKMLQEASDVLEADGFVRLAALARLRRAELYFADGQTRGVSKREAQHVADLFADQEDLPHLARATLLQARLAEAEGDIDTAQELCRQALDIAQGQGLLDLKYYCDDLLGQLAEKRGDLVAAARYYDRAVHGIDEVQSRLVLDERTSFLEDKGAIYQRAIILALKRGDKDQALTYVEKAKSRVLGDYLRNNIDIRIRADDKANAPLLEALNKLREEQAWYSAIVYETESEANLSDTAIMRIRAIGPTQAKREMQRRERDIERLLGQIQLYSAGELSGRLRSQWSDNVVTSLWPKLERNSLMLEYYLADQDLYIFQLARGGINVCVVEGAVPKLERLLSLWRANLEMASRAAGSQDRAQAFFGLQENSLGLLQRLYDLLLNPVVEATSEYERLVIVPYGLLHYIPFHCLFDGVQFVVERFDVSYLPAASLLDICRQRGQRIEAGEAQLADSLVMGLSDGGRLAFAVQEAEAVARQLGARPALNEVATTALLREVGAGSPIIHIAAHGLFRLDAPNFSDIRLADRQLNAIEVFNLDLSSCSLVTLSACETGRAVVKGVDEVIGLGRGFLYAGAASILPTLWRVDDASSAELMESFYRMLLNGHAKATALAGAQRDFLAKVRTSIRPYRVHPYFWAAFHLIGDAGPLLRGLSGLRRVTGVLV